MENVIDDILYLYEEYFNIPGYVWLVKMWPGLSSERCVHFYPLNLLLHSEWGRKTKFMLERKFKQSTKGFSCTSKLHFFSVVFHAVFFQIVRVSNKLSKPVINWPPVVKYDGQSAWEYKVGKSCYHVVKVYSGSWQNAEAECQKLGAHLLSINSFEEYHMIIQLSKDEGLSKFLNTFHPPHEVLKKPENLEALYGDSKKTQSYFSDIWMSHVVLIGLKWEADSSHPKWTDQSPYSFSNWADKNKTISFQLFKAKSNDVEEKLEPLHNLTSIKRRENAFLNRSQSCTAMMPEHGNSLKCVDIPCSKVLSSSYICEKRCNWHDDTLLEFTYDRNIHNAEGRWTTTLTHHYFEPLLWLYKKDIFFNNNRQAHCPEYWISFEHKCYRVRNREIADDSKAMEDGHLSLSTNSPFAKSFVNLKTCYHDDTASNNNGIFRLPKAEKCFIHVMMSHWTDSSKSRIFINQTLYLYKTNRILYDPWNVWGIKRSDFDLNISDFNYVLQETNTKKMSLPKQWAFYICQQTSEILPIYYRCDGHAHCTFGDDEHECNHTCTNSSTNSSQYNDLITLCFRCKNGTYIPFSLMNNGIPDCRLHDDETKKSLIIGRVSEVPINERCIYARNRSNPGTSHCLFYECPYHFKCPNTFCIPLQNMCDNFIDCPHGEDETQSLCTNLICHHMFKCVYGFHYLHPDKLCDGIKDCLDRSYLGEDESVCDRGECHPSCICYGHALACISANLTFIPSSGVNMRAILFRGNHLNLKVNSILSS